MGSPRIERHAPHLYDHEPIAQWLQDNPGWLLYVTCQRDGCFHSSWLHPASLLKLRKPPVTWGDAKARMRCGCGCREFEIATRYAGRRRD